MAVVGMPFRGLFGLMCPSDDGMRKRLWGGRDLHTTVRHGHGVVRHGVAGDLAVVGTGGGGEGVARVDKVGAGGVSSPVGPGTRQTGNALGKLGKLGKAPSDFQTGSVGRKCAEET